MPGTSVRSPFTFSYCTHHVSTSLQLLVIPYYPPSFNHQATLLWFGFNGNDDDTKRSWKRHASHFCWNQTIFFFSFPKQRGRLLFGGFCNMCLWLCVKVGAKHRDLGTWQRQSRPYQSHHPGSPVAIVKPNKTQLYSNTSTIPNHKPPAPLSHSLSIPLSLC